jgi:hypothetical protein
METNSVFWDDLTEDLKDPEFSRVYADESAKAAGRFTVDLPAGTVPEPRIVGYARNHAIMRMFVAVIRARGGNIHGVNAKATAKRRAANKVARAQRKANRG